MSRPSFAPVAVVIGIALAVVSCQSDFAPASLLTSVRILAVKSDTPYVKPGATFSTEVLAYDGRKDKSRAMRLYWLKDVCVSPTDAAPGDCYQSFQKTYPTNQDLTPLLTEGPAASFQMPANAVEQPGSHDPIATALVFVAACAGHVRFVGISSRYPDRVPFGCFDDTGARLGDSDFVFAFFRAFVSSDLTNSNPEPTAVTLSGKPLTSGQPFSVPRCGSSDIDDCPARGLAVVIGDDQQEVDPTSAPPGTPLVREQVWSSFFVSSGKLESESVVLFDARHGRLSDATDDYRGPLTAGTVDLFVVTHDNRSGVSWQTFQLEAE